MEKNQIPSFNGKKKTLLAFLVIKHTSLFLRFDVALRNESFLTGIRAQSGKPTKRRPLFE